MVRGQQHSHLHTRALADMRKLSKARNHHFYSVVNLLLQNVARSFYSSVVGLEFAHQGRTVLGTDDVSEEFIQDIQFGCDNSSIVFVSCPGIDNDLPSFRLCLFLVLPERPFLNRFPFFCMPFVRKQCIHHLRHPEAIGVLVFRRRITREFLHTRARGIRVWCLYITQPSTNARAASGHQGLDMQGTS